MKWISKWKEDFGMRQWSIGIIAFVDQTNKLEEKKEEKKSLKWTRAPPVGENWRGGDEEVCVSCRRLFIHSFFFLLYLCHVMPLIIRQQHGRSRSSDVALMCLIYCSVVGTIDILRFLFFRKVSVDFHLYLLMSTNICMFNVLLIMIDWLTHRQQCQKGVRYHSTKKTINQQLTSLFVKELLFFLFHTD